MNGSENLFQTESPFFADVILPLPLPKLYTYKIPSTLKESVSTGCRVLVQFGKKRIVTAVIKSIHQNKPQVYEAKEILEVLDEEPLVNTFQLNLFEWVANYYLCNPGDVLNAAIPSGLKLSSESKIQINPDFDSSSNIPFSDTEELLIDIIDRHGSVAYNEIPKFAGIKRPLATVKSLLEKKRILLYEEVKEKYAPKTVKKIRLHHKYADSVSLEKAFDDLKNKPKQTDILLKYLSLSPVNKPDLIEKGIDKFYFKDLAGSDASLRNLVKAGIFEEFQEIVPRFPELPDNNPAQITLSERQTKARDEVLNHFQTKDTVLLHGITGSGKTEVFIDLINQALSGGSQVLYLLPEIALTTQIVNRLRKVFGSKMGVYHSKFSDNERVEVYKGLVAGKYNLIIGVRSSVFLPFDNLGLIVVDEEHETSYKQYDPAPRYHARDTALVLAKSHNAKTLLGTATPSVESYYNCKEKNWGLVELLERYSKAPLPEIIFNDLKREKKFKTMRNDFSGFLLSEIEAALQRKEQIILFQNRRGFAPYLTCDDCSHVFSCKSCDVSLTYHLYSEELRCHYCGHYESPPTSCPACGSAKIKTSGFGTEKIEEDLKLFLPEVSCSRMDLDTTRKKNSYQKLISSFEEHEVDVLVGTQMVTKGLDFDNVSLVGIFDTDRMLYFPDFRSHERTFQVLTQVSGRAGRKSKPGKVIVQTNTPEHEVFKMVKTADYITMYNKEIEERRKFFYPPFARMIKLTVKNPDVYKTEATAKTLHSFLAKLLGQNRVLGPEVPVINKIRNYYLMSIYIKIEREGVSLSKAKDAVLKTVTKTLSNKEFKSSDVVIDVDPM